LTGLTLGDDQSDPTEASPGLDDAVADRIQEIQSGGDWRKTKALRQKHLSRKEGATVTKRNKKSTKALWKQALVTRSAAAESQSDSELAHDSYDSSGRMEHSAATTVAAQTLAAAQATRGRRRQCHRHPNSDTPPEYGLGPSSPLSFYLRGFYLFVCELRAKPKQAVFA
jgi:hypothetical protein